jgi:hypothetical protein
MPNPLPRVAYMVLQTKLIILFDRLHPQTARPGTSSAYYGRRQRCLFSASWGRCGSWGRRACFLVLSGGDCYLPAPFLGLSIHFSGHLCLSLFLDFFPSSFCICFNTVFLDSDEYA